MKFSNNAVSTLNGGISAGATSFSVQTGAGALFPSLGEGEFFFVRLGTSGNNEVVKVTGRSGDAFTCEATSGDWADETAVVLTVNAEAMALFAQANGGGQVLQGHELRDYAETCTTPASSSGALTLDLKNGNVFEVTLTEATTLTFSNPPAAGKAGSLTLILKQDATGGRAVTWPAAVKWAGGAAPTLSTDANAVDVLILITTDAGATWYGMLAGAAFA